MVVSGFNGFRRCPGLSCFRGKPKIMRPDYCQDFPGSIGRFAGDSNARGIERVFVDTASDPEVMIDVVNTLQANGGGLTCRACST